MQSPHSELSGAKLTVILLTLSAGSGVVSFALAVQLTQQTGYPVKSAIVPFTLIVLVAHTFLWRMLVNRLTQINLALNALHQNKPVTEIETIASDAFKPLIESVNALIRERGDLKTMRGQLVEQISAAAAQEERNRLARDLHDSIKQQVFSMSISAAAAHAHLDSNPSAARQALMDVKQSAQEAMVEMRALLQQLSPAPLEKSGLVQALRDQCEALAYRTGAAVETRFGALPPDDQLPPGTQESLFRIAQEALSNIARHARAQHVHLALGGNEQPTLTLTISDDGQGFNPDESAAGMGLSNIRARAASIGASVVITSQVGAGAVLTVTVPLVEPVTEEKTMKAQYEAQVKPIVALYLRFAISGAAFVLAISMLLWRLLARPENEGILLVLLIVITGITVISLPVALWSWFQAWQKTTPLVVSAGRNSQPHYRVRRYQHFAYLVIAIAAAWFLPIMGIGFEIDGWLRVMIGVVGLAIGLWHYAMMGSLYRSELALMSRVERVDELNARVAELRTSWWTTGFAVIIIAITSLSGGGLVVPPLEPDHWMDVSFLTIGVLLLLNQLTMWRVYRRYLQDALNERLMA